MSKAVKALSVILILAALFGLVGGGLSVKDALDSKSYYEKKGEETDANFKKLDDGINQLEENDQKYHDGKAQYEDGKTQYEDGKEQLADAEKQLADGKKTLDENREAYESGKVQLADAAKQLQKGRQDLAAGKQQLAAGEQQLAQAKALLAGLQQLQSGFSDWQAGYNGLNAFAEMMGLPAPASDNVETYNAAIDEANKKVSEGLAYCDQLDQLKAQKAQLEAGIQQTEAAGGDASELKAQLAQVEGGISQIEAGLGGETRESLTAKQAKLQQLPGVPAAVANGQQALAAGLAGAMNGVLADAATAEKVAQASGMSVEQIKQTVGALPGMPYDQFNATMQKFMGLAQSLGTDVQKQITDGEAALAQGRQDLAAGQQKLAAGEQQYNAGAAKLKEYEDGLAKYEDGMKQYEEGKKTLEDAEKQLADAEEQLAEFEDGRAALIDGLNIVMEQEDEGITSVADRLDKGFSFMRDDTDIDYDAARKVVKAGRGFSSDSGDMISKEIWTRVYGTVAGMVGSLLGLLAGVLGLKNKFKGSGLTSILTALLGAGNLGALIAAGSKYSEQAGASAITIALAAAGILACAALLNGIASFGANKKANV